MKKGKDERKSRRKDAMKEKGEGEDDDVRKKKIIIVALKCVNSLDSTPPISQFTLPSYEPSARLHGDFERG